MSFLAISSLGSSLSTDWITPQEQLQRFALTMAEERLGENKDKFGKINDLMECRVVESASRSILKHLHLSQINEVPSLFDQSVNHFIKPTPLPSIFTDWYTARKRLKNLPEKIPSLPLNIHEILNERCPIYGDQTKPDGTHYTVNDTHILQLLCEEDGNLNEFEAVVKRYGEEHYHNDGHPFQFRYFSPRAYQEYGNVKFEPTH
jgi:hypothetical protein